MTLRKVNSRFPDFPRFFDDFFTKDHYNWGYQNIPQVHATLPSVNILESHDGFTVEMAAPGMEKSDFHIELDNGRLHISSNKELQEEMKEGDKYTRREFSYQSFQRTFTLPKKVVDDSKIQAKYENGILRILIPKKEEVKTLPPRQIVIS